MIDTRGLMGAAGSVPSFRHRLDARFRRIAEWMEETTLGEALAQLVAWLRRRRLPKRGTLAPVIITSDGVVVPSVDRVPLRSSRADAKRAALTWARQQFRDPQLTWGQARKRIRRFERAMRDEQRDLLADAAIAVARDE